MNGGLKRGFSLLEVLIVVIVIGILSALAYSSLVDLINTNKAKEAAREMTAFTQRALAEGHMRKIPITITLSGNTMQADTSSAAAPMIRQALNNGFEPRTTNPPTPSDCKGIFSNEKKAESQLRIGQSVIDNEGCFVVCSVGDYCGATVKTAGKNTFTPYIKKRSSTNWELL
jgi:prepilin-type N-terminal cleavage/methylation domain-containing protein